MGYNYVVSRYTEETVKEALHLSTEHKILEANFNIRDGRYLELVIEHSDAPDLAEGQRVTNTLYTVLSHTENGDVEVEYNVWG